jgi:hypothetical protein
LQIKDNLGRNIPASSERDDTPLLWFRPKWL